MRINAPKAHSSSVLIGVNPRLDRGLTLPPPDTVSKRHSEAAGDYRSVADFFSDPAVKEAMRVVSEATANPEQEDKSKDKNPKEAEPPISIEDALEGVDKDQLIKKFTDKKRELKGQLINIAIDSLAAQSAAQEAVLAVKNSVAPSLVADFATLFTVLEKANEIVYIKTFLTSLGVSKPQIELALRYHIERRWGPEPLKIPPLKLGDTVVTVDGVKTRKQGQGKGVGKNASPTSGPLAPGALGLFR